MTRTMTIEYGDEVLLALGVSPEQFSEALNRPALTILRTLSGSRVYKGIRPVLDD